MWNWQSCSRWMKFQSPPSQNTQKLIDSSIISNADSNASLNQPLSVNKESSPATKRVRFFQNWAMCFNSISESTEVDWQFNNQQSCCSSSSSDSNARFRLSPVAQLIEWWDQDVCEWHGNWIKLKAFCHGIWCVLYWYPSQVHSMHYVEAVKEAVVLSDYLVKSYLSWG